MLNDLAKKRKNKGQSKANVQRRKKGENQVQDR